ncbi:DUF6520 family protein [Sinomicrobium sp. M5D2P9]
MKKFKIILPSLAFVFAIAFSFASVKSVDSYAPFFIQYPDACVSDDVPCSETGNFTCTVLSTQHGILGVYEQQDLGNPTLCQIEVRNITQDPVKQVD